MQIVTDAHLQAATDLSNWEITRLGDNQHLVVARNLEDWYGQIHPSAEVLGRGREDWGGALLTPEIVRTHRNLPGSN